MALYFNRVHNHSHTVVTVAVVDPDLQIRGRVGHLDPEINSFVKLKTKFVNY